MAKQSRSKKTKRARRNEPGPSWLERLDESVRRRIQRTLVGTIVIIAVVAGGTFGMQRLEQYVRADRHLRGPAEIVLVDVPEGLDEVVYGQLGDLLARDWSHPTLCRDICNRLHALAWVREVDRVRSNGAGRVEIRCQYRTPVAMVQRDQDFAFVDADGVRLPGSYPYSPSYPLIRGVQADAPSPGRHWPGKDLVAGLRIVELLKGEPYRDQVTAVLVENYGGRRNAYEPHIELATDKAGGRIVWGSAPGDEFEENSVHQKLALLRRNHELHGRADAGLRVIDISTFPDRFITPSESAFALP